MSGSFMCCDSPRDVDGTSGQTVEWALVAYIELVGSNLRHGQFECTYT